MLPACHRLPLQVFLLALCLTVATHLQANAFRNSVVTLSTGATATLVLPVDNAELRGLIVLIHGWSGSPDEVGDLFKRQAHKLAEQGFASIRMGIRGESERAASGYRLDSTFLSRVADAKAGVDWITERHPGLPIGLLGFSYGGATALELVSQAPLKYDSVVLWSTTINPNDILLDPRRAVAFREAIESGEGFYDDWTRLTLTRAHVIGMIGFDPMRGLKDFKGAILSLHGSLDYLPLHGPEIIQTAGGERAEYRVIKGADHIFNAFDSDKSFGERILNMSAQWFDSTLSPTP